MESAGKFTSTDQQRSTRQTAGHKPRKSARLRTLDDLDDQDIPTLTTSFNTCTRSGEERRQQFDRRATPRADCVERRSGRDRRMMTYF